ncbi:acyl-CoA dehydrogenase [Aeromicrobium endophyticum]|uniref:Acyl-CoA dehydrogenase n=2 Tax=Aeromicrobium endophyticum TaxID=2292704 RepID=A0A371PDL4_9ACTN|nr:acyl-CoA dehydrogenase [Aeromicrobium endophyticum]
MTPLAEHADLRDIARSLLSRAADHEQVRAAAASSRGWSEALWSRLNDELAVGAMLVPETLGGAGFGLRDVVVILEEAGAALLPEPILFSAVLAASALAAAEDPASVGDLLAGVVAGSTIGTVCLGAVDLTVEGRHLTGTLPRVVAGAEADVVVLRSGEGVHAVALDGAGVAVRPLEVMDSTRRQAEIVLDGAESVLLSDGAGAEREWGRLARTATISSAAEHVGIIGRQLASTVEYVGQRQQFGRAIGSFQAVKHRLADLAVDLERARSAVAYAAALHDEDPDAELPAAVAGAVATDAVVRAVHEAVQLHGGIGFTWEHPAHLYVRRALGDEGLFGSARRRREDVAALVLGR